MLAELAGADRALARQPRHLLRRAIELAPGLTAAQGQSGAWSSDRTGPPGRSARAARRRVRGRARQCRPLQPQGRDARRGSAISTRRSRSTNRCSQRAPRQPQVWTELWPHAQDRRSAGGRHRRLSPGDRARARRWARRGGASPISRPSSSTTPTSRRWRRRWRAPELADEDRFHLDFALGKALHDAGRSRRGLRPLRRGQRAAA